MLTEAEQSGLRNVESDLAEGIVRSRDEVWLLALVRRLDSEQQIDRDTIVALDEEIHRLKGIP